jgi:hypothetical protein
MEQKLYGDIKIFPNDWHKTFPYYFEIMRTPSSFENSFDTGVFSALKTQTPPAADVSVMTFFLPIPPQSYTIQHLPATEAHATLGGVVEETSAPVFWSISLVGTTGVSLNSDGKALGSAPNQRKSYEEMTGAGMAGRIANAARGVVADLTVNNLTSEVALPFQSYGSAVNVTKNSGVEDFAQKEPGKAKGFFERMKEIVGGGFAGEASDPSLLSNGFAWNEALKHFFLIYQREKAKNPSLSLYFVDVKTNSRYRCIPRSVQFQKSSQSPYMTQYNIVLKCWDLKAAENDSAKRATIDRFSGDLQEAYTVNAVAMVSSVKKTLVKFNRVKDIGGSFVRDSAGSFLG